MSWSQFCKWSHGSYIYWLEKFNSFHSWFKSEICVGMSKNSWGLALHMASLARLWATIFAFLLTNSTSTSRYKIVILCDANFKITLLNQILFIHSTPFATISFQSSHQVLYECYSAHFRFYTETSRLCLAKSIAKLVCWIDF